MAEDKSKNLHKKPTKQELEQAIDEAIDGDSMPSPSTPAPTPSPSQSTPTPSPSQTPPSPSPSAPPPSPSPSPDWKGKYKGSTREGLVHQAARQYISEAIEKAKNVPQPTEEELQKRFGDWDVMSDTERSLAIDAYISNKRFEIIAEANEEGSQLDKWIKKVEQFAEDPQTLSRFPNMEGKAEEFRAFAIQKTRRGVPLVDLASAFLYDATERKPKKNKSQMFEQPGGGTPTKENQGDKYDPDVAAKLRESNYDSYKVYIKRHQKAITSGADVA